MLRVEVVDVEAAGTGPSPTCGKERPVGARSAAGPSPLDRSLEHAAQSARSGLDLPQIDGGGSRWFGGGLPGAALSTFERLRLVVRGGVGILGGRTTERRRSDVGLAPIIEFKTSRYGEIKRVGVWSAAK